MGRREPSKDDLIVAYLEQSNERFWDWFDAATGEGTPHAQLVNLFEALATFATSPACFGCMFQLAASDFPDPEHPANRIALAHKNRVLDRFRDLASQAESPEPEGLAAQLLLLMDGAFVASRMFPRASPAAQVGQAAKAIITSGTRRASPGRG